MSPVLHIGAVAPVLVVGIGAMIVLLAELWISSRESFLGRPVTPERTGSTLSAMRTARSSS